MNIFIKTSGETDRIFEIDARDARAERRMFVCAEYSDNPSSQKCRTKHFAEPYKKIMDALGVESEKNGFQDFLVHGAYLFSVARGEEQNRTAAFVDEGHERVVFNHFLTSKTGNILAVILKKMCYTKETTLMNLRAAIEQLGYSPHEITVYLAALELGGSTVTEIAAKAKLPRTTVNLVIHALQKKGLMNAYLKRRRKILTAENPERLMTALKESEAALAVVLPELQSLRRDPSAQSTVRTYHGAQEIKQIMNDILESKHHISAMLSWDDWTDLLGKSYLEDFIERRYQHYLRIRLLAPKTKNSTALKTKDSQELRVTQFLPELVTIANANFIYANKVAIITLNKKNPVGILIEDEDIHHAMEILFENFWRQSGGS
jgi:sugar-specific transcriptional regulator TrmB